MMNIAATNLNTNHNTRTCTMCNEKHGFDTLCARFVKTMKAERILTHEDCEKRRILGTL